MQIRRIVFVLGGPGSGKGTCCELLARRHPEQILHLSAGELLRRWSEREPDGPVARALRQGVIVPSHVTVGLLAESVGGAPQPLVLIDGFPRTAENRDGFLAHWRRDADAALLLDVPLPVMIARLSARRRADDSDAAVRQRVAIFDADTQPIIDIYRRQQRLITVSGDQPVEQVYRDARSALLARQLVTL